MASGLVISKSINDFRNSFNSDFPRFQLRIRDAKIESASELEKLDIKREEKGVDIAYFNGIKAFTIEELSNNEIMLNISENIYRANYTQYSNLKDDSEKIKDYRYNLIENLKRIGKYFEFELLSISFEKNGYIEALNKCLVNFLNDLEKIGVSNVFCVFDSKVLNDSKDSLVSRSNNSVIISKKSGRINLPDRLARSSEYAKIIDIELLFMKDVYQSGLVKNVYFKFNTISKLLDSSFDLKKFKNALIDANRLYRGKVELEKRYQHMLLLYANNSSSLFGSKKIYSFEQEYEIPKYSSSDLGRVDCVYYSVRDEESLLTDIYLVEVKIDDTVIAGTNGVLTHLRDIEKISKVPSYFTMLIKRINYRRKCLGETALEAKDYKIHFYTIFGYTKILNKEIIKEKLKILNDEDLLEPFLKTNSKEKYIKSDGKLISFSLDKNLTKDLSYIPTIKNLKDNINNIDIRFFFDKNEFDISNCWSDFIYQKEISNEEKDNKYLNNIDFIEWDPNDLVTRLEW